MSEIKRLANVAGDQAEKELRATGCYVAWPVVEIDDDSDDDNPPEVERAGVIHIDGKLDLRPIVRAILAAMREPSEDALGASPIIDTWTDETGWHTSHRSALASWRAMIDRILAEPE